MLVIKKELDFNDFLNDFDYELKNFDDEAKEIIFDYLCEMYYNRLTDDLGCESDLSDYLRYQLEINSIDDLISNYSILDDEELEEMTTDEIIEAVKDYVSYHTMLIGSYEIDGVTYLIHDEF